MPHTFTREMTITHADFFRLLPRALDNENFMTGENRAELIDGKVTMQVIISPEQNWKIGALLLPKTRVEIRIDGCDEREAQYRINKFDRTYQKGGG